MGHIGDEKNINRVSAPWPELYSSLIGEVLMFFISFIESNSQRLNNNSRKQRQKEGMSRLPMPTQLKLVLWLHVSAYCTHTSSLLKSEQSRQKQYRFFYK